MKRVCAIIIAVMMILSSLPALAAEPKAQTARTTMLDLSNQTTSTSNNAEGWSFNPRGYNNKPELTLNSYGNANQHSAPIKVPRDTRIMVYGNCYIDNSYMGEACSVIAGTADGILIIDGTGTLNLYATQYNGRCIDLPAGGTDQTAERLYINNITVNCYARDPDSHNAFTNEACIYGHVSIYVTNATINTRGGGCGLKCYGYTPIGGVSEETAAEIVIDSSNVNIQITSPDGIWQYAQGIRTTFGKIRITGNSNVIINAGSCSIYCYLSFTIEGGSVYIVSTPVSTANAAGIVYCGNLVLKNTLSSVYFSTTRYPMTKIIYTRLPGESVCESGVDLIIGSFRGGEFTYLPDPDNNDLPALKAAGSGAWSGLMGDVNGSGVVDLVDALLVLRYSMGLLGNLPVLQAADVDHNGRIDTFDALQILRASMGLLDL